MLTQEYVDLYYRKAFNNRNDVDVVAISAVTKELISEAGDLYKVNRDIQATLTIVNNKWLEICEHLPKPANNVNIKDGFLLVFRELAQRFLQELN